jgi:hypothetical protein
MTAGSNDDGIDGTIPSSQRDELGATPGLHHTLR